MMPNDELDELRADPAVHDGGLHRGLLHHTPRACHCALPQNRFALFNIL